MTYQTEAKMVDNFIKNKDSIPSLRNYDYILEFPYNSGRTDIVLTKINSDIIKKRIEANLMKPITKLSVIRLLYYLFKYKKATYDFLKETCYYSTLKKDLKFLLEHGYLKGSFSTELHLTPDYDFHLDEIIAIEAKLKNWKRAIKQAYGAKTYANYLYVLLDINNYSETEYNKKTFSKYEVGLMLFSENSEYKIAIESKKNNPYSWIYEVLLNELHFKKYYDIYS